MKKNVFSDSIQVAIDIGTTKICVLIARGAAECLEILGIGKSPSEGLSKGVVVDINKTVNSIKNAVKEAELMAGCRVESACIGVSGAHIKSRTSQGMIPIKRGEIKQSDITQVMNAARAVAVAQGNQILHVLPQYFVIDGTEKVTDPLGMYGVRLEVQVHIITGAIASVHNLIKSCELAGIKATDIVLEQLASADAVLNPDEKKLGVLMVDIGGGTSDVVLVHNNAIRHTMVLPVAGNHFTHDLALGLHTSLQEAERIKKEFGSVYPLAHHHEQWIDVALINGTAKRVIRQSDIISILAPRAREALQLIYKDIQQNSLQAYMPAGFVLTGGGSLMNGMQECAQSIFKVPVHLGAPHISIDCGALLNNPIYATGYGLLLHMLKKQGSGMNSITGPLVMRIMGRMKSWMDDFF